MVIGLLGLLDYGLLGLLCSGAPSAEEGAGAQEEKAAACFSSCSALLVGRQRD